MYKHLRFTAIPGLASIALFALAQIAVVNDGGVASGQAKASIYPRGEAVATRAEGPAQNPAISRMRSSINSQLNVLFFKENSEGRREIDDRILQVSNWAVLAGMTPEQQRFEIDHVLQLGKWKPNDGWDNVAAAPSMVSELLKLSPKTSREIQKILDESLAKRTDNSDGASGTKRVRALLTPAQNAEWTRIERTALEMARIAIPGADPFAPAKAR